MNAVSETGFHRQQVERSIKTQIFVEITLYADPLLNEIAIAYSF